MLASSPPVASRQVVCQKFFQDMLTFPYRISQGETSSDGVDILTSSTSIVSLSSQFNLSETALLYIGTSTLFSSACVKRIKLGWQWSSKSLETVLQQVSKF